MTWHSIRAWLKSTGYLAAAVLTGLSAPREGEAAVLMYHAVDRSGWRLSISPEEFDRQMAHLRRRHIVVPLEDIVALAKGGKGLPRRAVAVTFDDGYADLLPNVLPVIEKYRIPITVFLTTDLTLSTNSLDLPRISPEALTELAQSRYVTIESHGRTHEHLPSLSPEEVRAALVGAQEDLTQLLGSTARYFAYPYGDRSAEVEAAVEEAGYEAAFGITEGFVRAGSNLLRLPRIQVDATMSPLLYALRLTPALIMHRRIVDTLRRVLRRHSK